MKKINKRIPGIIPPPPKTEIDGKISNLSSKTVIELLELKERQEKLLNNKSFVSKLADKGAKIQDFRDKIVRELKAKQDEERACELLSNLNLNKDLVQEIEWKGKIEDNHETYLDSDDDSEPEDLLQILSQNTAQEKKITTLQPEKSLVTPQDLINFGEQPYIKHIVDITEHNAKPKISNQFKPYKTTITNVHNPDKEILRKKHKNWEVTAATPPPIVHGPAKVLSIEESLSLQREYNLHLKEVQALHAAEKLLSLTSLKMAELPKDTSRFGGYRNVDSESELSDVEGSDKEIHDEEPERGGVIFTVMK